jgi:hypothetical protein
VNERVILKLPAKNTPQPEPSLDQPSSDDSGLSLDEPAEEPAPQPEPEQPVQEPTQEPAPENPEQGGDASAAQQLAGKLGQEIRTKNIDANTLKGVINQVIAAAEGKLDGAAIADIEKKLNQVAGGGETAPAEQPVQEIALEEADDVMSFVQNNLVNRIINKAKLQHQVQEFPEGVAFEIAEAIYVFILDYNDNSDFIRELSQLLREKAFKARHNLSRFEDLSEIGQSAYNALVKMEQQILNPQPQNKRTLPSQPGGFSLNENQKLKLLSKLK